MRKYAIHPLAGLFPLDTNLVDEIAAELRRTRQAPGPVMLYEGKILDGRHRYLACLKVGIEPFFRHFTGKDPCAFVIRHNITRRHLTDEQRADIAAKLATRPAGRPAEIGAKRSNYPPGKTQQEAADLLNVSVDQVKRAKARQAGRQRKAGKRKPKSDHDLEFYKTQVRNLVMGHLVSEDFEQLLEGLCQLDPPLADLINEVRTNDANGPADGFETAEERTFENEHTDEFEERPFETDEPEEYP